jgi:hypothetical protein
MYRIGRHYGLTSLKLAATLYAASIIVSPIEYLLEIPASSSLTSNPMSSYSLIPYLLLVSLLFIFFGLAEYVSMIVGFSGIYERTKIADFNTAKIMWIIGIVLLVTVAVGLLFYGRGLKKLASQQQAQTAPGEIRERGYMYCPQCGAKVTPNDLFCGSCGFNLRKDSMTW